MRFFLMILCLGGCLISGRIHACLIQEGAFHDEPPQLEREAVVQSLTRFRRLLLSQGDLRLETVDRFRGPALRSLPDSLNSWEAFNEWLCFDAADASLGRVEIEYEGRKKVLPQLDVFSSGYSFEFALSADVEAGDRADHIEEEWRDLVHEARVVCIYAALLQDDSEFWSTWIVSRVKTDRGYWIE